jgi:mono/diheme cytochrome c family protein
MVNMLGPRRRAATAITTLLLVAVTSTSIAASNQVPASQDDGQRLYRAACAACHGPDGRGQPRATVGFETPLPDFTDCAFATPEADADWIAVVHRGGRVRAFDRKMPAFGEALTERDIQQTISYLRSFCSESSWPRGELNLPRALVTEKAFPENETVLTTTVAGGASPVLENEIIYERRLGARSQVEVAIPVAVQKTATGSWQTGLGDAALAFKHALFHSLASGTIVSAAAEVIFPTGKEAQGFGSGGLVFEPFIAVGKILPADGFVQFQAGVEIPRKRQDADDEFFWRTAVGKSFMEDRFGRVWTPMLEVLGARPLAGDTHTAWDVVPQMQVTLSRRQHIMISAGLRIPLTDRRSRDVQVVTYLLWDWVDGGLFDGWR